MNNNKYKPKELKVFGSPEWLAESRKKYRCVFDQTEISYIYAEYSFYNKLFDEEDWEATLTLSAYDATVPSKTKKLCEITKKIVISKNDNICYYREGWGMDIPGEFWKPGAYYWEAAVDGTSVLKSYFYIEKFGKVTSDRNPYFDILNIKLFEGPGELIPVSQRNYYKKFKGSATRYIWVELEILNRQHNDSWYGEFFFNFYNDVRQLKGQINDFRVVTSILESNHTVVEVGWGSNDAGVWFNDKYTAEIVFMDQLIAVLPFEVGNEFEQGTGTFSAPEIITTDIPAEKKEELDKEEIFKEIDALIGLDEIKHRLRDYESYINFIKLREAKGFQDKQKINLHAVFTGNPGTGKTTVAKLLGKIYQSTGLLSKGTVHQVDRSDLIAKFIGQTAPKVKEVIESARGGILFIDEAYSLARSENDTTDFGHEAIEIILKELSEGPGDLAIIVAGYPREMKTFINSNPGLKSRFTYWYNFPDYLPQELIKIADYACSKRSVVLAPDARELLFKKIVEDYRTRDRAFGNARYVNSLIEEAKMNLGLRVMRYPDPKSLLKEDLSIILLEDVKNIFSKSEYGIPEIPIDEDLLRESVEELNNLIGITSVKNEVNELIKLVRFYREIKKDVLNTFSLHSVFTGNPGTGKTTVARIIAKIYKALGLLEKGHLVECDRESLVAGFIGQTAIKTAEKIEESIGGVLFIDEAYALSMFSGSSSDFGLEAIEVILKRMEDKKNRFAIIAAGYTKEMDEFLKSNPGLKSRFDKILDFEDYSCDDLIKIALKMLKEESVTAEEGAIEHLRKYFDFLVKNRDRYFGNARVVKKVIAECIKNQHLRLASIPSGQRNEEMIRRLVLSDVEEFKPSGEKITGQKQKTIGFSLE